VLQDINAYQQRIGDSMNDLTITTVYDNNKHDDLLRTDWGFACIIQGLEKAILFDTGADALTLLGNMSQLGLDPTEIDCIVLSHSHGDHVGGLRGFLHKNPEVTVFMPATFSRSLKDQVTSAGAGLIETTGPMRVCKQARTTRVLGGAIPEQGLMVETPEGMILITGCAHPGIVQMAQATQTASSRDLLVVIGGFHLARKSAAKVGEVIDALDGMRVRWAGPCHCSGDATRERFRRAFGDRYLDIGVGSIVRYADLSTADD